jgi:hypothetical protein
MSSHDSDEQLHERIRAFLQAPSTPVVKPDKRRKVAGQYNPETGRDDLIIPNPPETMVCRICRHISPFVQYSCFRCGHVYHKDKMRFLVSYPILTVNTLAYAWELCQDVGRLTDEQARNIPMLDTVALQWVMDGLPNMWDQLLIRYHGLAGDEPLDVRIVAEQMDRAVSVIRNGRIHAMSYIRHDRYLRRVLLGEIPVPKGTLPLKPTRRN